MQSEEDNGSPEQEREERIPKPRKTNKQLGEMLSLRETLKGKKPEFNRQKSWRYKRVKESWRRPRGIDSKMRKKVKGWPQSPRAGYRGPKATRGLHPSGYVEILVQKTDDVDRINPKTQAVRIGHTVGAKKRGEISASAKEKGIHILNPIEERGLEETKSRHE